MSIRARATLEGALPNPLEVGLGNVVLLEGTLDTADPPATLEVAVGTNRAQALTFGLPTPGERLGSSWWQSLVPIGPVEEEHEAAVAITVRARDGAETTLDVATLRVAPGLQAGAHVPAPQPAGELVAICLATYEPPGDLLRVQLESIRAQTHASWICLVSDDGASPQALAEIENAISGDSRFVLQRNNERAGFYRNFERALRMVPAEATHVALCDQDDRWRPEKLAALLDALGPDDVLAHSDARVVDALGELIAPTFWADRAPRSDRLGDLLFANAVSGASAVFRAEALPWILPLPQLPGKAFHDRWIALVCKALGGIAYVGRPLYDYVQHDAASHGHARAVGRHGLTPATAVRGRITALRTRGFHPDWRAARDDYLLRAVSEAMVLRLRVGDRLSAEDSKRLARMETLPWSAAGQARLALRWLARASRGRPGLEGALGRGVLWSRLAPIRRRALARSAQRGTRRKPMRGGRGRTTTQTTYGIVVTRDTETAGFGDYFTGHELGEELERLGAAVAYLESDDRGWTRQARSLDVIVSLLDRFPIHRAPLGVTKVAWVRNWTERWLSRGWFEAFDLVLASSEESCRLIRERSDKQPHLMPLATNPARFDPVATDPKLAADLTFVGNHWGVERQVDTALPQLAAAGLDVKVFGHGWEEVRGMRELSLGPVSYQALPKIYASAEVVVDDSASHTRRYGAVNSRVFDALACGAYVASNDSRGAAELFDEDLPTWSDTDTLRSHVERIRSDPTGAKKQVAELRRAVLDNHTYAHRARQLHEATGSVSRGVATRATA